MTLDAELFVALGFILFAILLIYLGAHKQVAGAIDARIRRIENELAEAKRLRVEADALLGSYKRKAADAEAEAAAIVSQAKAEAELMARETAARMADFVERRKKQAEEKIANAEAQATAQVRAAAADAAVKAAEIVIRNQMAQGGSAEIVGRNIDDLKRLLH